MLDVSYTRAELMSPTDLGTGAVKHISLALKNLLADVFALYLNFLGTFREATFVTTTCCWTGKAIRFSRWSMQLPNASARSAERRSVRSAISSATSALPTTTRNMSARKTCSPNCARTISD
jgi:hypothetical protein